MFYCDDCRKKNKWPEGFSKSFGNCEACGKVASCNSVSSKDLPPKDKSNVTGEGC